MPQIIIEEVSVAPSAPSVNRHSIYVKASDGIIYIKDSAGVETPLAFTAAFVLSTILTGLADTSGTIASTDTLLTGLGKIKKAFFTDHSGAGGAVHANAIAAGAAGFMTGADKTKLDGVAAGATANSSDAYLLARANHTGTESADVLTDGATNKAFLATERTKLTGIATGATANQTDAYLLARANHTGTQLLATISDAGTVASLSSDTDGTLAANSDAKVATQKAIKTYVDNAVTGLLDFKGSTDCSANPNYPAALKGDSYVVSVAGKIGGASGTSVDVGDVYAASADNAGGTEASVGTSWFHLEHNLVGALLSANNLSDLGNAGTARTNLGVAIGSNVQAYSTVLDALAALAANKFIARSSSGAAAAKDITDFALTFLDDANAAAVLTTLGAVIGTNVQAYDATLAALAGQNWVLNSVPVGNGADTVTQLAIAANKFAARSSAGDIAAKDLSDFALTFLDDANAAAVLATLGAQAILVSATNIKTINSTSLLGSGDIVVSGASPAGSGSEIQARSSGTTFQAVTGSSISGGDITIAGKATHSQAVALTATDGVVLATTTVATVGAQKMSPRLRLQASGWKTTATAAAQNVEASIDLLPVQGAAAPTGLININTAINGGAFANVATIDTSGNLRLGAGSSTQTALGPLGGNAGTGFWFNTSSGVEVTYSYLGFQNFTIGNAYTRHRSDGVIGVSSTSDSTGTTDTSLSRISAGLWGAGTGAPGSFAGSIKAKNITASGGIVSLGSFIVSTLPSAATTPGGLAYITDSLAAAVLNSAVVGGGSAKALALSDGSAWNYA